MAKRTVVYVSPNKKAGGWDVQTQSGGSKAHFETKPPAIDAAKSVAKAAPLGQVKIQKENGRLQTEYTYGADPRDRKG
jgi:hypothetical protein